LGAGGGVAQASALVGGVAEAVGFASFEFDHPVEALACGVGHAGEDRGDEGVAPAVEGLGQGE